MMGGRGLSKLPPYSSGWRSLCVATSLAILGLAAPRIAPPQAAAQVTQTWPVPTQVQATLTAYASSATDQAPVATPNLAETAAAAQLTAQSMPARRPIVFLRAYHVAPPRPRHGSRIVLTLELHNVGRTRAESILVTFVADRFPPTHTSNVDYLSKLEPDEHVWAQQELVVPINTPTGTYVQQVLLEYDDPEGNHYSRTEAVGIDVAGVNPEPTPGSSGVALNVQGFDAEPAELFAGDVFSLKLRIANVGSATARHVRLVIGEAAPSAVGLSGGTTAQSGAAPFAAIGTSNVRFRSELAVGAEWVLEQRLRIDPRAEPGMHSLAIGLQADDGASGRWQSSEAVSLLVARRAQLRLQFAEPLTTTIVGQTTTPQLEVINVGRRNVNVTYVELRGDQHVRVDSGSRFVGPLDAGASDILDIRLVAQRAGEGQVEARVHYLDDFDRAQTYTWPFTVTVEAAQPEAQPVAAEHLPQAAQMNPVVRFLRGILGLGS